MQVTAINDRGSNVTMLGAGKRNAEIGNAAKKLQMLGLSDEIDHSDKKPEADVATSNGSLPVCTHSWCCGLRICVRQVRVRRLAWRRLGDSRQGKSGPLNLLHRQTPCLWRTRFSHTERNVSRILRAFRLLCLGVTPPRHLSFWRQAKAQEEEEEEPGIAMPVAVTDVKSFVMTTIPKAQV